MPRTARERVLALIAAARRLADPADPLGRRVRRELPDSTGLSPEGVELGLTQCLETNPSDAEIDELCSAAPTAPTAHVLLSASVFVAAHRAIALALASSERVFVRPSRREPLFVELLREAAQNFDVVSELSPEPDQHLFAYGTDETLSSLRASLPAGVVLHAHGAGFGVAVIEPGGTVDRDAIYSALARDVVAFDQRGCLSPRLALIRGEAAEAREAASALAEQLARLERDVPRGRLAPDEQADIARYRDSVAYAAELVSAGSGFLSLDSSGSLPAIIAPVGRNLHVMRAGNVRTILGSLAPHIAAVGFAGGPELRNELRQTLPKARFSAAGEMQRPRFDGAVDLRADPLGEIVVRV